MANQSDAINDVATLSRIPNKIMDELIKKETLCIGSIIHDAIVSGEQTVIIGIGIGTLSVNLVDMNCKFVPNKELKATIKNCITNKVDPLEIQLEKEMVDRLISICEGEL